MPKRAVGIVRVSQTRGRSGETFHSPITQRDRIIAECERQGFDLIEVHEELDVSGGKTLDKRPGLNAAVMAVEAGEADIIVAAYLDRLTRSVRTRADVIERVEAAGGMVLTVDMGVQTDATAGQWLSGTLNSAVAEYLRRTTAERSAIAQQRSIDRGVIPFTNVPPGYKRTVVGRTTNGRAIHGPLEPDPVKASIVKSAFRMRAEGETIADIRDYLRANGIRRSYHGVGHMLASRIYLGEINFGDYTPNLTAHPPIIDLDLWQRVQAVSIPRGRRAKSERLLARLGVLRCATCNARLVVGTQTQNGRRYPFYRCIPTGDCPKRVAISATMVEEAVVEETRRQLRGIEGTASTEDNAREAEAELARAQADLDAAISAFAALTDEPAARNRLAILSGVRDEAAAHLDRLSGPGSTVTIRADEDWDLLNLAEKRALIRATIDTVTVAPGRGPSRITIRAFSE